MSTPSETTSPPLMAQVRELIRRHNEQGWDEAWYVQTLFLTRLVCRYMVLTTLRRKISVTPWDAGQFQPPLKDLIDSKIMEVIPGGTALVPGCGRVITRLAGCLSQVAHGLLSGLRRDLYSGRPGVTDPRDRHLTHRGGHSQGVRVQNLTFRYIRDGSLTRTGPRYLNATSSTSPVRYEVTDFFALKDSFDLVYDYT